MSSALPLKTPTKSNETTSILPSSDTTPTNSKAGPEKLLSASKTSKGLNPKEISSPHELTAFVENLLEQLDTKFDEMSTQVLDRMSQMSARVDSLEASIQDIINGDITVPQSPGMRKSDSGGF